MIFYLQLQKKYNFLQNQNKSFYKGQNNKKLNKVLLLSFFQDRIQQKMTDVPTIDITRFRMNSNSSIDHYNSIQNDGQQNSNKKEKDIPLILKKMNSVEKYINQFKTTQMIQKKSRPRRQQSPLYDPSLSTSKHLEKLYTHTPHLSQVTNQDQLKKLQQKCYVKYNSNSSHNTGSKMQALQQAQSQYVKLKYSIHTTGINDAQSRNVPKQRTQYIKSLHHKDGHSISVVNDHQTSFINSKSISLLNKKKKRQRHQDVQSQRINRTDIQKELKTSVIQQNGKKYFADLYLMKKQRDKMLRQIFGSNQKNNLTKNSQAGFNSSNISSQSKINIKGSIDQSNNNNKLSQAKDKQINRNNSYKSNKTGISIQKSQKSANKQLQKRFPKLKVNFAQIPTTPYEQKMKLQQQNFVQQKSTFQQQKQFQKTDQRKSKKCQRIEI